ncbi:MAG: PAS domain S-box protein [Pseudomonadota bacterium]
MGKKLSYAALERRVTELEQADYRARSYLSVAKVLFVVLDTRGDITLVNKYGLETLGYTEEELVGKNWFKTCLQEQFRDTILEVYHQLMAGDIEPVEYYENPVVRKDGRELIIAWHNTLLKDSDGAIVGSLSSGNDITEQTQVQEALRKSEEAYRNILENMEDGYLEVDLDGNFRDCNRSFHRMMGYTKEELTGRNYMEFMDNENRDRVFQLFHGIYETREPVSKAEWKFLSKDGKPRHSEASVSLVINEENEPVGFRGFGRDITDRKKIEAELQQAKDEWEQTFDAVHDLIMIIDNNHRVVRANKAMADRMHMRPEEMTGKYCYELVHGLDNPPAFCPHSSLLKDNRFHSVEVREERLDADFIVTVSPIMLLKDGQAGSVHVAHDITLRKKAEEILALSESRFRDISLSMADWIWEVDATGRYIFSAGKANQVLGYDNDELLGKTPFDFMVEDEAETLKKRFKEIIGNKQPIVDLKNWNLKKDGTRVCLLTNGVPFFDDDGELLGYRGVDKDITRDLQIAEKLKQALETTEKIIDNVPIGMLIVGKDKIIQRINKAALAMTGYKYRDEIVGHVCHKSICPAKQGQCPITDLGLMVDRSEKIVLRKDGRQVPVYKTALPLIIDGQDVIIEAFMDISPLKEAENALTESREKLRAVMETIVDPVIVYDTQGKVTYLNPGFTRVFGWSADEVLGRRIDFVPEEELTNTQQALAQVLSGEALSGFESRRKTSSGAVIAVRIGAALLLDPNGLPSGIVVNIHDITREKKTQDELSQMNQELEKAIQNANMLASRAESATEAKSSFLANMSHEIRTPLNGVIGMTGLLLDTDLTRDQRHCATVVKNSGEALLRVINDILDFSKIEAGKLEIETIDFDLRSLLDDFASMMSLRIQQKNVEFVCAVAPEVPALLQGDPGRLRQILTNLVGNAVKFTEKGEISVLTHLEKESPRDVTLLFSVKDTGIGIPENKQGILFQSFSQADASTTRKYGGTGLGLAISKKLSEIMGGEIGLNSSPGKGSEFWFTACFQKQKEAPHPVMPMQKHDLKGVHILVVDDNDTNREILQRQLGSWGCRVTEAMDGQDALRQLHKARDGNDPFGIAILDMQMPGMDGMSLGSAIKADDKLKEVHMVMMTSIGQAGDARRFEKAGFAAYLIKPVGYSDLLDCLTTLVSCGARPEQETAILTRHSIRELQRGNIRILLAEDNIVNQQVARGILKKFGFTGVHTVLNGSEAVKAVEGSDFDLVLMDVQMPEMDGFEATRNIRRIELESGRQRMPVIAMTAHAMAKDRDLCIVAGMDDYLTKPIDPRLLSEALDRWLPKKKTPPPAPGSVPGKPEAQKTNAEKNLTVFDKIALLGRLMGDEELLGIIIRTFLDDAPRQIAALRQCISEKNTQGAGKQGHQLKGASGNVGGDALRKIASEVESAGKDGNQDELDRLLPLLEHAFDQLKQAMETSIG